MQNGKIRVAETIKHGWQSATPVFALQSCFFYACMTAFQPFLKIYTYLCDSSSKEFNHRISCPDYNSSYGTNNIGHPLKTVTMNITKFILPFILLTATASAKTPSVRLVEVGEGYSKTAVNTAVFRNNSIVTHHDKQYIAFYDADGFLTLGKRDLHKSEWLLQRTKYKGNVADGHNSISIMADGDGYLHVAFDHHGDTLRYCRSIAPESLELGEKVSMTGKDEDNVTYPEFYRLKSGDLIFVYRSGSSGRGNLVMNRYSTKEKCWTRVQDVLIDGENARNAYWQLCVDEQGVIHLSWVWRETWKVETNHDICYARSDDGGKTWYKSTGERYTLPIRLDNAEYACRIPQKSELINQTSMSTDKDGHPYIATYWRDTDSQVPQYRLVWHDGRRWRLATLTDRQTAFSLSGGGTKMIPIARPRIITDGKRAFYLFRDIERGSRVSVAVTRNLKRGKWQTYDLTDFAVNAWEPSHDTELWKTQRKLHLFVQNVMQGDGERTVENQPQMVYVLELSR